MRKPETTFIASVHRHMPPVDELYHMKNSNDFNAGIADVWYSGPAKDLWVEYKFIELPKRDTTVIDLTAGKNPKLSVLQQDWLGARLDEGRNIWVIVGCREGGLILKDRWWLQPWTTAQYRSGLLPRPEIARALRYFLETP